METCNGLVVGSVYFEAPNGHLHELITKPYCDLAELR